jgi:hypothetical protein
MRPNHIVRIGALLGFCLAAPIILARPVNLVAVSSRKSGR